MGFNGGPLRIPRFPKKLFSLTAAGNSGVQLIEAKGFGDWNFQLTGTFTGFTVTFYGTLDPTVANDDGSLNTSYSVPGVGGSWFALPAKTTPTSDDSYTYYNPLTANTQGMRYQGPLMAVCAVATVVSATGTCVCVGWAVD